MSRALAIVNMGSIFVLFAFDLKGGHWVENT